MKNCKGFSLLEVIVALSILSIISTSSLSIIITVYKERIAIKESYHALELLQTQIQEWLFDAGDVVQDKVVEVNGTVYVIDMEFQSDSKTKFCVRWNGRNERVYERCEYAKR